MNNNKDVLNDELFNGQHSAFYISDVDSQATCHKSTPKNSKDKTIDSKSLLLGSDKTKINTSVVDVNLLTRDKISYTLLDKDIINKGEQMLSMEKRGSADTVVTKLIVSLDLDEIGKISKNLTFTYFDKSVFDAVCSLLSVGNQAISLGMIARTMLGKKPSYHPNQILLSEINNSVNKLEKIKVYIDMSDEMIHFSQLNKDDVSQCILESRFFEFKKLRTVIKGKKVDVLIFSDEPILLKYAKMRSQISSIANYLLDTPTQKTKNSLTVQSYLLQKINILKLNKNLPQCIMYDAIYDLFDEFKNNDLPLKTKESMRSRIRKAITDILNFWVEEKFIEGYEIERKDKSYYKINIKI